MIDSRPIRAKKIRWIRTKVKTCQIKSEYIGIVNARQYFFTMLNWINPENNKKEVILTNEIYEFCSDHIRKYIFDGEKQAKHKAQELLQQFVEGLIE